MVKNSVEQIKGNILETITPEEFHVLEKIHQSSYKTSFHLTKKRHIQNFDELISKNKITLSVISKTYKKKWAINMSSRQLTHTLFSPTDTLEVYLIFEVFTGAFINKGR